MHGPNGYPIGTDVNGASNSQSSVFSRLSTAVVRPGRGGRQPTGAGREQAGQVVQTEDGPRTIFTNSGNGNGRSWPHMHV